MNLADIEESQRQEMILFLKNVSIESFYNDLYIALVSRKLICETCSDQIIIINLLQLVSLQHLRINIITSIITNIHDNAHNICSKGRASLCE